MELVSHEVRTADSAMIPGPETIVVPLGDVQYGPSFCDTNRLKKLVKWVADRPNAYLLGMGDMCDGYSPSNRKAIAAAKLYDTTLDALDQYAADREAELLEILAPTKGRWLGMLRGHHFHEYRDGTTSDTRLSGALGCPFLGDASGVELRLPLPTTERRYASLSLFAAHGSGSASTVGGNLNLPEKLAARFEGIDAFLLAHTHQKAAGKIQRLSPAFSHRGAEHRLRDRNIIVARTGGFLKGYEAGSERDGLPAGSYIEKSLLLPAALGGIVLWARPRIRDGYAEVDLDVSL